MIVAILCPGPSLHDTYAPEAGTYDMAIGVNRASLWYAVDCATMHDFNCLHAMPSNEQHEFLAMLQSTTLLTAEDEHAKLVRRWPQIEPLLWVAKESIDLPRRTPADVPCEWSAYSESVAIAFAAAQGAGEIITHGNDWQGKADTDGRMSEATTRTDERWERQALIFDGLAEILAERGTALWKAKGEQKWTGPGN